MDLGFDDSVSVSEFDSFPSLVTFLALRRADLRGCWNVPTRYQLICGPQPFPDIRVAAQHGRTGFLSNSVRPCLPAGDQS
jgi:hypothetical protein